MTSIKKNSKPLPTLPFIPVSTLQLIEDVKDIASRCIGLTKHQTEKLTHPSVSDRIIEYAIVNPVDGKSKRQVALEDASAHWRQELTTINEALTAGTISAGQFQQQLQKANKDYQDLVRDIEQDPYLCEPVRG